MSYRVVNLLPIRQVRRKIDRQRNGKARLRTAPLLGSPMRVVFRPYPGASEGEELLMLGALETLKKLHDRIDLVYVSPSKNVVRMLKGNWFLKEVYQCVSTLMFEEIVGDDFSITLFDPDPEVAAIAEEERYRTIHQREVEFKTAIKQMYDDKGMKDLVVDIPEYRFQRRWNRSNAYLWTVSDKLGLQINIPFDAIIPFGHLSARAKRDVLIAAAKDRITSQPFGVFDFRDEQNEMVFAGVVGKVIDPIRMFSIQEIEKAVGTDYTSIYAVLQSEQCQWVVAPVGDLLYAAWAANVPNILTMYQGANPTWDGIAPVDYDKGRRAFTNGLPFQRDSYSDEDLPGALYQGLSYMVERANE